MAALESDGACSLDVRMRINVGCGSTPTPGWENFDNSPSVLLARVPHAGRLLFAAHIIGERQRDHADPAATARHNGRTIREHLICATHLIFLR